jgi:hypothetical protein
MRRPLLAALTLLTGAGPAVAQRSFPVRGFDQVELAAAGSVEVHPGTEVRVEADGDPRLLDRLDIHTNGTVLVIGWRQGAPVSINHGQKLRISVTMPRVTGVALSGAGSIRVDRADVADFTATMRGAGSISLPALHARMVRLEMRGAGQINAAGTADRMEARMSGVGSIDAAGLIAHAGHFEMSGTGSIKAHVDGPADANASGMGSVRILGKANCSTHRSGFGSVRCGD